MPVTSGFIPGMGTGLSLEVEPGEPNYRNRPTEHTCGRLAAGTLQEEDLGDRPYRPITSYKLQAQLLQDAGPEKQYINRKFVS